MKNGQSKVALIGTGMVGMSYAYALLNQDICDELVLIDIDKVRAQGEAMDLNHGLAFSKSNMKIYAGEYKDCKDADIIVLAAGVAQKEGETRLDLLQRNMEVFRSIIKPVVDVGFDGIFLVATNPVDLMTRITYRLSGFKPERVIGTGTTLDTGRLRYLLGDYFEVDPRNIHAYVIGEHGDSEFVPWSQVMLATKPIGAIFESPNNHYSLNDMKEIEDQVRTAAYKIIEAKRATYYGIGMALTRITKAILSNENSVLTVSVQLKGEYGCKDIFIGVPSIIGGNGVREILELSLYKEEMDKFINSCQVINDCYEKLHF